MVLVVCVLPVLFIPYCCKRCVLRRMRAAEAGGHPRSPGGHNPEPLRSPTRGGPNPPLYSTGAYAGFQPQDDEPAGQQIGLTELPRDDAARKERSRGQRGGESTTDLGSEQTPREYV